MSKLILSNNGELLGEFPLDRERLTIGRKASNDIVINFPSVSAEHACVITRRGESYIEDLRSTNGTRVNGELITKHYLQPGDEIVIGRHLLAYSAELDEHGVPARAPEAMADTIIRGPIDAELLSRTLPMDSGLQGGGAKSASGGTAGSSSGTMPLAAIHILTGPSAGKELDLSRALTTLGKPGLQIAVITRRPQGYFFTHVEGEDYPLINGLPAGDHSHVLQDRDIIQLAGTKLQFMMISAGSPA